MNRILTIKGLILMTSTALLFAHGVVAANPGITAQFHQLDANQDGMLTDIEVDSRPDLTRYMNLYNYGSFGQADVNEDGHLDKAEFAAFEEELPAE